MKKVQQTKTKKEIKNILQIKSEEIINKIAKNPAFQAEYVKLERKSISGGAKIKLDMRKLKGSYKITAYLVFDPYKYVDLSDDLIL